MELIKELPEVFEEFAEQRQKSFMAMKGLKGSGSFRLSEHIVLISRQRSQEQWEQLR
mgnify:CR=1 FL=1